VPRRLLEFPELLTDPYSRVSTTEQLHVMASFGCTETDVLVPPKKVEQLRNSMLMRAKPAKLVRPKRMKPAYNPLAISCHIDL